MKTALSYLATPQLLKQTALITARGSDEKGTFVITDITPAYPQGGGQESDNGTILCETGKTRFVDVRYYDGIVKHYIQNGYEHLREGMNAEIIVDEIRRKQNSILHSAGHLVASVAYTNLPSLTPTKGHHFSEGSYIELSGELSSNADKIKAQLQSILNDEIKTEKAISYEMVTADELKARCPFIQPGLPTDKPLRVVNIESYFPMGCGGTHVQKLNEIPALTITKIKLSRGIVRISYRCSNQ
jgi:alanyl-tRNA synthetase